MAVDNAEGARTSLSQDKAPHLWSPGIFGASIAMTDSHVPAGLTSAEAARRLARDGPNQLPQQGPRSILQVVGAVLREPMLLLLLGAVTVYLILGDAREALVLAVSLVAVVAITVYQERRTEHALAALRDLASPRALVLRDGRPTRIAGHDVVRGDVLVLAEGDRIAADGIVRDAAALQVDESLLTGESVAVAKTTTAGDPPAQPPGGDALPFVYSGTLVVRGRGLAEVTATGAATQMGHIGRALATIPESSTPLQRQTARMVRVLAIVGLLVCVVVVATLTVTRGSLLDATLAGITLAMTLLPEEFPVVLTIFLALGAWRIARHGVLTRRAPAIETLGSATVLAVDKTGTLTENRMRVAVVAAHGARIDVDRRGTTPVAMPPAVHAVVRAAFGACEREAVDPMERAIVEATETLAPEAVAHYASMQLVQEYELSSDLLAVVHVWRVAEGDRHEVAAKGAPEAIAGLCRIDGTARVDLLAQVSLLATEGLRVLAVAQASFEGSSFPAAPQGFDFTLLGLVALEDPIRPSVPAAIAECDRAGIRVVMITGDYPETARAAARSAGIDAADGVMTGVELDALADAELARRVRDVRVFARMQPMQKLRLVHAFRANGDVVAMTGDGVNDAPALKAAHIGVAMGRRGTDVAREAAALVLLEDDFTALVASVRAGRRIYENLRNAMSYLIAVHVPLGGMGLIPVLAGWPLFFFPVHVVVLEFIIDPACSLVFEAERASGKLMAQPPRPVDEPLFSRRMLGISLLLGLTTLAVVATVYGFALRQSGEQVARALAFAALIAANLTLILVMRSRRESALASIRHRNVAWLSITVGALLAVAGTIYVPAVASLFRFSPPPFGNIAFALVAGAASVLWFEGVKVAVRRRA